jgi:DNA-binding NarL/FixJ family response regulator
MTEFNRGLIGRDRELAILTASLDRASAGEAQFAVVSGEPGIGKTRLVAELIAEADRSGCLTLEGQAAEFERELPFGLFVDAFDAYLESLDPHAFERLAIDRLGELAAVFPSLRELGTALEQPTSATERFRVHNAVRELIERLAARQPLLLTLDDTHWADGASAELIAHLLRRRPQAAVMIVVAHRTGLADPVMTTPMNAGIREGLVIEVGLGPLALDDTKALLSETTSADPERLHHEGGGNPFYVLELARAPRAPEADGHLDVPATVTAAIATELESLSAPARALAEASAVVGDPFELEIAAAAAGVDEAAALGLVDELVARRLIRAGVVPRRFQFRHPLVRSAVYAACPPGSRLAAHERAAVALAERGAPARVRAHHVEQAARHGDLDAVTVLHEAGRETADQAPSSAVRWFAAASRLLPAEAPTELRLDLLTSLAGAQSAVGRFEEARSSLLEAIDLLAADQAMLRIRLSAGCAAIEQLLGRHQQASGRLLGVLDDLEDRDSPEGVAVLIALSDDGFYRGDYEGMHNWAIEAGEAADRTGDPGLRPATLSALAMGAAFAGETDSARVHRDQAAELVDAINDEAIAQQISTLGHLAGAELYLDLYPESAAHAERGARLARKTGQGELVPVLYPSLGTATFMLGRTREAGEILEGAVESARLSRNAQALSWTLFNRSLTALMAGDVETALTTGKESVTLARQFDNGLISAWGAVVLGAAMLESGDPHGAIELVLSLAGGEQLTAIPGGWRVLGLELLTQSYLATDRPADARRTAGLAAQRADATGLPLPRLLANRAAASVQLADGDPAKAAELALAAVRDADQIGARVDAAIARKLAGRALGAAGERERAIQELELAAAGFEACDAPRYRKQVERELRKVGHRIQRPSRRGRPDGAAVASLTERELEVARLVVDRQTNKEIAGELFLSLKTVETHMRNIFRKLDVGSRTDVARAVEEAAV